MSGIFGLPAELRNRIWRLAVVGRYAFLADCPSPHLPGILRASRQSRTEAIGIWLFESEFSLLFDDFDFAWMHTTYDRDMNAVLRSAYRLGANRGESAVSIPSFVGHHGVPHWQNLLESVKALHKSPRGKPYILPAQVENSPSEMKVAAAAYNMVQLMRSRPWAEVEQHLENWHVAVAAVDARWA
ncbi:hypothetical protein LTR17_017999 [Elasticomyces elasticus]|nr:hypothetical protein LTR17_017999 [Elasticomyces elasticus]